MSQVLTLAPDFLEVLTWNDAGESHNIGQWWLNTIDSAYNFTEYAEGYDHTPWQNLISSFIPAYQAGATDVSSISPATLNDSSATLTGAFWYTPLLVTGTCSSDPLGEPDGYGAVTDTIEVAIIIDSSLVGSTVNVTSGGTEIADLTLSTEGLNAWSIEGIQEGIQTVNIYSTDGAVLASQSGTLEVVSELATGLCNYNIHVVALP